ncbi:MAG: acyltransferase [Opitutaceae bacterium]|jgi:peptidoglycan/LPS O-acetylase OafA/YrhL
MQRSVGLDLMRAVAISLVLLQHFLDLVRMHSPWVMPFCGWALIGVDIFFALSGFLIGKILLGLGSHVTEFRALLGFWTRRWLRTLPVCYVMLPARLLIMMGCLHLSWKVLLILPRYFVFMQCWASPFHGVPFFEETWSLAVEEWFYLLFPLVWAGTTCLGVRSLNGFVFASVAMLFLSNGLRFNASLGNPPNWLAGFYMVTVYRFDSVALGLLAAALDATHGRIWARLRWPGLCLGLTLLWLDRHQTMGATSFDKNKNEFLYRYLCIGHFPVSGLGSALLLPWFVGVKKLFWLPLQNLVGIISRWSYSLYLTHGMFVALAWIMFSAQIKNSSFGAWMTLVIVSCLSFVLAGVLHEWIEIPAMNLRERWKLSRRASATPVGLIAPAGRSQGTG